MSQQSVTLVFQAPSGAPLAGGQVQIHLGQDASLGTSGGPSVNTRTVLTTLDGSGSCTVLLWPNDALYPAGTVYFVNAYTASGQLVWSGQMTVDSSGNVVWVTT
jgi:hypothetical protein